MSQRVPLALLSAVGILIGLHEGHKTVFMESWGFTLNYLSLGALLLLLYGYRGRLTRTLPYKAVSYIGLYSYGIYLWHLSVREPIARLTTHLPSEIQWIFLFTAQYVAAIVLGIIVTKAVEFPMLKLRDRLIPRETDLTTALVSNR